MRRIIVKLGFALLIAHSSSAMASNTIVELGTPKKSPIKAVGIVPVKKHIPLQLGTLRNDEAELPVTSTLKSRMKKRLRIARQRQRIVGEAKRSANQGELRLSAKPKTRSQPLSDEVQANDELPADALDQPTPFDN
jgi:hypothetical protein